MDLFKLEKTPRTFHSSLRSKIMDVLLAKGQNCQKGGMFCVVVRVLTGCSSQGQFLFFPVLSNS